MVGQDAFTYSTIDHRVSTAAHGRANARPWSRLTRFRDAASIYDRTVGELTGQTPVHLDYRHKLDLLAVRIGYRNRSRSFVELEGEGNGPESFDELIREGPYHPYQLNTQGKIEKTGGCLCGGVRYRVTGPLRSVVYCHCSQCRRTSGHFVAATAVAKDALTVVADESLEWFASSEFASRGFCSLCGSSLFWLPEARDYVCIMAGTLDESTGLEAVEHIYVKDKGDYYDLTDDLPKASGHR